ncbi:MAG: hypothetical protein PHY12_02620 [Eubacteriales bacterium]|nr:hypothetical protein [Eubacteriales bacterium]
MEQPIMVLVTLQRACARLIRKGANMAMQRHCPLHVVHVTGGEQAINAQVLDYLYALSGEAGAEMCVLTSSVAVTAMADYAQQHGVRQIVMGGGERASGIAETLSKLLPGVEVLILEEEEA